MALRIIRKEGDEILRKISKPVTNINKNIITLLDDMHETMKAANGMGLAAPQVGVLKRICLVSDGEDIIELINPEIIETADSQMESEGCLSIPGVTGKVERPLYVKVRAKNRRNENIEVEGSGVTAVAFCHEIDHLNGILFVDKAVMDEAEDDE